MSAPKHLSAYSHEKTILDTVIARGEPLVLRLESPGKAFHAKLRLNCFMKLAAEGGFGDYIKVSLSLKKQSCEILINPQGAAFSLQRPNGARVEVEETEDFLTMKAPEGTKI